jgi:hypothetical protein
MAPTEPWVPATIKARSPDDVVVEIVEKIEPVVAPVMVKVGAVASMAGHVAGAGAGATLILDPDPGASKAVGYYMLVVNADGLVADVMTLGKGEPVPTVLNQGVKAGLIRLGRTESQAEQGAAVVEFYSNTLQAGKMAMMLPLGGPAIPAKQYTVVRYAGPVEAQIAQETGFIPNVSAAGKPKFVFVTPDAPLSSASQAESTYKIGAQHPLGPFPTPTHVIIGNAKGVPFEYGGIVEGASGVEMTTRAKIPVIVVRPIGGS